MTKAIFTFSESSAYDDQPEVRYHFPSTYLRQAKGAVDDWVIYYEPRRTTGPSSATGRQCYFAVARVVSVLPDKHQPDHYYAYVDNYLDFDNNVPFRESLDRYYESILRKADGSTNRGAFGRAVREIPDDEFAHIVKAGFVRPLSEWERIDAVKNDVPAIAEEPAIYTRPVVQQVSARPFRDAAFSRHVRHAYRNTCAVSGLCLINGGGRPEVQAAHIRPVAANGPDSVRNGLALTGTIHWLFDRGLIAVGDNHEILTSPHGLPDDLQRLLPTHRKLNVPDRPEQYPHPAFLSWHRENVFKP